MDIILKDLKAKYQLLSDNIDELNKELMTFDITKFVYQPKIEEIIFQIKEMTAEREKISRKIIEYTKEDNE